jgi:hypothetical protein
MGTATLSAGKSFETVAVGLCLSQCSLAHPRGDTAETGTVLCASGPTKSPGHRQRTVLMPRAGSITRIQRDKFRHASWSVVACKSACRGELIPRAVSACQDSTVGGYAADADRCRLDLLRPTSAVTAFRCSSRWRSSHATTIDSLDDAATVRLYEWPRRVVVLAASGRISWRRIVIGMASALPRIASSLTTLPFRANTQHGGSGLMIS